MLIFLLKITILSINIILFYNNIHKIFTNKQSNQKLYKKYTNKSMA